MTWRWPLPEHSDARSDDAGAFGAARRHDVHTGVDLHCPEDALVTSVEPGVVVAVEDFTGPDAGSPWWLPTKAVLVEGDSGVVVYGEVTPLLAEGSRIGVGIPVGYVRRVLRNDKGRPTAMLHLELMAPGARTTLWWRLGADRPAGLLDPTAMLAAAREGRDAE
ncbi:MAG TPA: hypothetical protein VMZ50_08415 [Phycisphaerae bacterium]|nr:hypothetical protein [Phycisphaerae bacterium]